MDNETTVLISFLTLVGVALITNIVFLFVYRRTRRDYKKQEVLFAGTYVHRDVATFKRFWLLGKTNALFGIDQSSTLIRPHIDFILSSRAFGLILTTLAGAGLLFLVFDPLFMEPLLLKKPTRLAQWIDSATLPDWLLFSFIGIMVALVCINAIWSFFGLAPQLLSRYTLTWSQKTMGFHKRYSKEELIHIDLSKPYSYEIAKDKVPIDPRYPVLKRDVLVHIFTQDNKSIAIMEWLTFELNTLKKAVGKHPNIDTKNLKIPYITQTKSLDRVDSMYEIAPLHFHGDLYDLHLNNTIKNATTQLQTERI